MPLDTALSEPRALWDDYFEKRTPSPVDIRNLVVQLNEAQKFEHVIAVIESAIRHDQVQPWMFPVLATTMKIVGRPPEAIERVLLSQVDYGGKDVSSMVYSGAYLTRFGAERQALKMYQQASLVAPARPEPYIMGLRLARKLKDYDAVEWAAAGILTNAWTPDYRTLHQNAINAVRDSMQELTNAGKVERAEQMEIAMAEARKRDLALKLTWSGEGDVDLIVEEPWGTICSSTTPQTAGGGAFVHDGAGPEQKNSYDAYVCAEAVPGFYRVRIRHIWGTIVGKRAKLEVIRYRGSANETRKSYTVVLGQEDAVVRISLKEGRRSERRDVPRDDAEATSGLTGPGRGRVQLTGGVGSEGRQAGRRFQNSRAFRGGANPGFQPVVRTLGDGVSNAAMAVISGDRRYVRLSLNPAINTITDVFTFSFINSGAATGGGGGGGIRGGGGGNGGGQGGN